MFHPCSCTIVFMHTTIEGIVAEIVQILKCIGVHQAGDKFCTSLLLYHVTQEESTCSAIQQPG